VRLSGTERRHEIFRTFASVFTSASRSGGCRVGSIVGDEAGVVRSVSVPVAGAAGEVRALLDGTLDGWAPGAVVMHSPRLVRTRVRVWLIPIVVELVVDGEVVRSEPGRRRVQVLPVSAWLPEVDGVVRVDASGGSRALRLVYEWRVQRGGAMPGWLADRFGASLARVVVAGVARRLQRRGRSPGAPRQAG
jgi:hypothetical protein